MTRTCWRFFRFTVSCRLSQSRQCLNLNTNGVKSICMICIHISVHDMVLLCSLYSCVFNHGSFFVFGYAIPSIAVGVLSVLAFLRRKASLSTTTTTTTETATDNSTGVIGNADAVAGRDATRLVIVVVVVFAIMWLPIQVSSGSTWNVHLEL